MVEQDIMPTERGGGSSRVEDRVELYFGQAAIYRQNADIEYERKRKSLKRI